MGCTSTFFDHLSNCNTSFKVNALLQAGLTYSWVITDKFDKEYEGQSIADADGFITIQLADLPDGFFTPWSGPFELRIRDFDSCGALPLKIAQVHESITFEIKGGSRVKDELGCPFDCVAAGTAPNAFFPFNDLDDVVIEWTSLLKSLYGNAPDVTVYHETSPDVYTKANVEITLVGGPYDLQSIQINNGGVASGYVLING